MASRSHLRLNLLGPPSIHHRGRPVHLRSSKALALLGFLAMRHVEVSRAELDGLLWPESDRTTARRSLRGELSLIGKVVPFDVIESRSQYVSLCEDVEVDLWQFDKAIFARSWEHAATLYRGGFMEGLFVRNAEPFETWHRDEQDRLQTVYLDVLDKLSERAASAGEYGAALAYTQQIIRTNPLSEAAYIKAMRLAKQLNEHAMALDIYHDLLDVLKQEFGIPPSREASRLAREVESASYSN